MKVTLQKNYKLNAKETLMTGKEYEVSPMLKAELEKGGFLKKPLHKAVEQKSK